MPISDNIKNGLIASGRLKTALRNAPTQYGDRQRQYLGDPSTEFVHQYAKYATDFFAARVQGLNPDAPYEWETTYIRMADIAPETASTLRKQDDYKKIMFADESIEYVPEGTKIEAMGSIWLVTNPQNISNAIGGGVIQRCRSTWNHLDWYGNLLQEPLCVEKAILTANDSDMQEYALITKGYVNITCQRNEYTKNLNTNSRMILGSSAFRITGFGDYAQEFTGNYDSVRLLEFTARYEPPNEEIDDMEHHVAGGKTFSWEIRISGNPVIKNGSVGQLKAISLRMGKQVDEGFDHPISYLWESSDPSVADVGMDGTVYGVSEGTCTVTCRLEQNCNISESYEITIAPADSGNEVAFLGNVPDKLHPYETVTLQAALFENGAEQDDKVSFTYSGADDMAYSASESENETQVTCWSGSDAPLKITATAGDYTASVEIVLGGI